MCPGTGEPLAVGGIEHQEDSKLRAVLWLGGHGPEGRPQPGTTPATLDPSKRAEMSSAFRYRRAKNEARMYFLFNDAASDTLKEPEGSPK